MTPESAAQDFNLSAILKDLRVRGSDWAHIRHSTQQGMRLAKPDAVVIHIVTRGSLLLQVGHDKPLKMNVADVAVIPLGADHALRTQPHLPAERLHYFDRHHGLDIAAELDLLKQNEEASGASVTLSGVLYMEWPTDFPLWSIIAPVTHFKSSRSANARMRAKGQEVSAIRAGGSYGMTKYGEMMIARMFQERVETLPHTPAAGNAEASKIHQAIDLIEVSPGRPWTVASLAESVGMSRSTFAEKFHQVTGTTPKAVIDEHRMKAAARLLLRPGLRVKEVAAQVGYHSETSFARRFSKLFGTAPRNFRRRGDAGDPVE